MWKPKHKVAMGWVLLRVPQFLLANYHIYPKAIQLCGPSSVVGIANGYGLDSLGIESWWGRDFPHPSSIWGEYSHDQKFCFLPAKSFNNETVTSQGHVQKAFKGDCTWTAVVISRHFCLLLHKLLQLWCLQKTQKRTLMTPNQRMREISKLNTPLTSCTAEVQRHNKNNWGSFTENSPPANNFNKTQQFLDMIYNTNIQIQGHDLPITH